MSFLQSWIVWALPLALVPILIHLIHRRRHRVLEWGAMMFLLEGARMSRGKQRLREILLLALRTLAILGLLVGVGRPIAGGWVGRFGGSDVDTVVLVIDRSASMSEAPAGRADSKLALGVRRVQEALRLAPPNELLVVDAVRPTRAISIDGPDGLDTLMLTTPTAAAGDLAAATLTAVEQLDASGSGRAELWVLSDGQASDWSPDDGRWSAIAERVAGREPPLRVRLSALPALSDDNVSVRVERARREAPSAAGQPAHLVLDIVLSAASPRVDRVVPVAVETAGARAAVEVELSGTEARLQGHRVPIDANAESGHGVVSITADARSADDRYYFVYGEPPPLETVIVHERADVARVLAIAAELPLERDLRPVARQLRVDAIDDLARDLASAALLIWQAPLPTGAQCDAIESFVGAGGHALFLPPDEGASDTVFRGLGWGEWTGADEALVPESWRTDDDLLRTGDDGTPIPVGEIEVHRRRAIVERSGDTSFDGAHLTLASLPGSERMLVRATSTSGGVWFFGLLPALDSSNLASEGVVLVALLQRALRSASLERGSDAHRDAGKLTGDGWVPVRADVPLAERHLRAGVLQRDDTLVALNRPASEDTSEPLTLAALEELFEGAEVVATQTDGDDAPAGLLEEVWRLFLGLAVVALIGEALLCITEGSSTRARENAP